MGEFRMPALGADMTQGTVTEWHVKPGDAVRRGDVVATVDTDKADIDVEVFEDGVVGELLVPAGERVAVGTPLATIVAEAPGSAPPVPEPLPVPEPPPPPEPPPVAEPIAPPAPHAHRPRVSPLARRAAQALGVDVAALHGTGPDGAVVKADVERAAGDAVPPPPPPASNGRPAAMREAIGALMARSKREIPHYYLERTIDLSAALAWVEAENAERPVARRLVASALLVKAVALAAREVPETNGLWNEGRFAPSEAVHVGMAISLRGGGLIAPALLDVAGKPLDDVMHDLRDLVRRARTGKLRATEMTAGTITVSALGDEGGADLVHGVIYPPQVALAGFGAIRERPWAQDGMIGARPTVIATLAADHRVSDGHRGALFLAAVDRLLQNPEEL